MLDLNYPGPGFLSFLWLNGFIHSPIHPSIHLSTHLSIHPPVHPSMGLRLFYVLAIVNSSVAMGSQISFQLVFPVHKYPEVGGSARSSAISVCDVFRTPHTPRCSPGWPQQFASPPTVRVPFRHILASILSCVCFFLCFRSSRWE